MMPVLNWFVSENGFHIGIACDSSVSCDPGSFIPWNYFDTFIDILNQKIAKALKDIQDGFELESYDINSASVWLSGKDEDSNLMDDDQFISVSFFRGNMGVNYAEITIVSYEFAGGPMTGESIWTTKLSTFADIVNNIDRQAAEWKKNNVSIE